MGRLAARRTETLSIEHVPDPLMTNCLAFFMTDPDINEGDYSET